MRTRIFRIVHVDNLPDLIQAGGVYSPNHRPANAPNYVAIHHTGIQDRRARTPVPCGPGGVVHDYVASYFTSKSPMLYANHMGRVGDNGGGQEPIVCLVGHAEAIAAAGLPFVFTDGHAIMKLSNFYDDLQHLSELDWKVIRAKYWNEFDDGRRLRQAEFLVHGFLPLAQIQGIAVMTPTMEQKVTAILNGCGALPYRPPVRVVRAWYF